MPKNNTEEPTSWWIHIIKDSNFCTVRQAFRDPLCMSPERKDEKPRRCIKCLCPRVYNREEK